MAEIFVEHRLQQQRVRKREGGTDKQNLKK